ncbi:hypothetical protein [Flavobacterium sp.]
MKKLVASFFVSGLFLLLTSHAFSFESNIPLVSNDLGATTNLCQFSKLATYNFLTTDTVIYTLDIDDGENINTSFDKKNTLVTFNSFKGITHFYNYNFEKTIRKIYYTINFSRLPRFTFISLRVLRL